MATLRNVFERKWQREILSRQRFRWSSSSFLFVESEVAQIRINACPYVAAIYGSPQNSDTAEVT